MSFGRKFPTKQVKPDTKSTRLIKKRFYINAVSGREGNPRASLQSDYTASVGDTETHDHVTFQMSGNGVLTVWIVFEGDTLSPMSFAKYMLLMKQRLCKLDL